MANHLIHDKFVGAYVYAITVDGLVRYIGKGRRHRAIEHFRWAREINRRRAKGEKIKALPVHNRLAKALRNGAVLAYEIIANGMDDEAAYEREIVEIAAAPKGQLWNIQPGGAGPDGSVVKALWSDPDFRARLMATRRATMYENDDWRELQRERANEKWADPDFRKKWMSLHRAVWDDPEAAEARRQLLRTVWSDPEKTKRKRELVRSQWTPERKAAQAENRRKAWADPEFKKRVMEKIAASRTDDVRKALSKAATERWAEPEFREKTVAAIRAAKRKNG